MTNTKTKAELTAEHNRWSKLYTDLVQGYRADGRKVTSRNMPQDLQAVCVELSRLENELAAL